MLDQSLYLLYQEQDITTAIDDTILSGVYNTKSHNAYQNEKHVTDIVKRYGYEGLKNERSSFIAFQ